MTALYCVEDKTLTEGRGTGCIYYPCNCLEADHEDFMK